MKLKSSAENSKTNPKSAPKQSKIVPGALGLILDDSGYLGDASGTFQTCPRALPGLSRETPDTLRGVPATLPGRAWRVSRCSGTLPERSGTLPSCVGQCSEHVFNDVCVRTHCRTDSQSICLQFMCGMRAAQRAFVCIFTGRNACWGFFHSTNTRAEETHENHSKSSAHRDEKSSQETPDTSRDVPGTLPEHAWRVSRCSGTLPERPETLPSCVRQCSEHVFSDACVRTHCRIDFRTVCCCDFCAACTRPNALLYAFLQVEMHVGAFFVPRTRARSRSTRKPLL